MKSIEFISVGQYLGLTIVLIPLWWIMGVKFFIFHLVTLLMFVWVLLKQRERTSLKMPLENYIFVAFIAVYMVSLVVNLSSIPFSRIIASVNNLSFWILGFLLIYIVYNSFERTDYVSFFRSCMIFGIGSSVFVISAFTFGLLMYKWVTIKSLVWMCLPDKWAEIIYVKAPLLKSSLLLSIVGKDKLFERVFPRSPGFNVYGTALGLTMLLVIVMSIAYIKVTNKKKRWFFIIFLETVALILSLSRTTVIGFLAAIGIVFIIANIEKSLLMKVIPAILIVLLIFLVIFPPKGIINTFSEFRKGSTIWRARLYQLTLSEALKKPVLGYGFKPRTEDFPVPIGSHSTFIGMIYKTGFLGLVVFLLFWVSVLRKWWIQKKYLMKDRLLYSIWYFSGIALFGGLFWMVTEDLDAPPIVAFLYFIVVGIVLSLERLRKRTTKA